MRLLRAMALLLLGFFSIAATTSRDGDVVVVQISLSSATLSCDPNCSFMVGVPSGTSIGTYSIIQSPNTFAFYGTVALSTSSGSCNSTNGAGNSNFQIVSVSGTWTLETLGAPGTGTYAICAVVTETGATGGPLTIASTITGTGVFPLKVSSGVLVNQQGQPYMIVADTMQDPITIPLCSAGNAFAACQYSADATQNTMVSFFRDRAARGFNTIWFFPICEPYTDCSAVGATFDGLKPMTAQITVTANGLTCPESPQVDTQCWDLATAGSGASAAYWTRINDAIKIAAGFGLQLALVVLPSDNCAANPGPGAAQPSSWGTNFAMNQAVSATKLSGFAQFLVNTFGANNNIIWDIGNDHCGTFANVQETAAFTFAQNLKTSDAAATVHHLVMLEVDPGFTSFDDNTTSTGDNWPGILPLNALYQYGVPYDQALRAKTQSGAAPVFMIETNYEGEDNTGAQNSTSVSGCSNAQQLGVSPSCAVRARHEQWWTLLSGGVAGYIYSNHYTWQLCNTSSNPGHCSGSWNDTGALGAGTCGGNFIHIDTPAVCELNYMAVLLRQQNWSALVPDIAFAQATCGTFVTAGCGTYTSNGGAGGLLGNTVTDTHVSAGVASDGSFGVAYLPENNGSITVAFSQVNGSLTAQWYDPTKDPTVGSSFTAICNPNPGPTCGATFTGSPPAGTHFDGANDWVLLVTGQARTGAPTAYLSASNLDTPSLNSGTNTTIPNGGAATLTWDSTNATSCVGIGFTAGTPGIGTVTVSPTSGVNTYSVNCGGATASATVTVSGTRRDAAASFCAANGGGDGSSGNPWKDTCIQAAINAAASGDTIFLAAGNWALNIGASNNCAGTPVTIVNKTINLVGAGSGNTFNAQGQISNANGTALTAPTSQTGQTVTRVYGTNGSCNRSFQGAGTPGGYIQFNTNCVNDTVNHIFFDGSLFTAGGDAWGLLNFNNCGTGPIVVNEIRLLAFDDSNLNPETQFAPQSTNNMTITNSLFAAPPFIGGGGFFSASGANQWTVGANAVVTNNYFFESNFNGIAVDNLTYTGNYNFDTHDPITGLDIAFTPGFGVAGCAISVPGLGLCASDSTQNGSGHITVANNYFNYTGHNFGAGGSTNDPGTAGGNYDLHFTGNTIVGRIASLDSCIYHTYDPTGPWPNTFNPNYGGCAPNQNAGAGGMQINGSVDSSCNEVHDPAGAAFIGTNNSMIGSVYAELDAAGTGIIECWTSHTTNVPHTNTVDNFQASQNYLQSPSNIYNATAETFNAVIANNFCNGSATLFSGCLTSGFNQAPTVAFTLGILSGTTIKFASTSFTAQYGAVKWIASTSPTTPISSDSRWYPVPPASLSPVAHGNTVYMWTMDNANHISAVSSATLP